MHLLTECSSSNILHSSLLPLTAVLHQLGVMASIYHNPIHPLGVTQPATLHSESRKMHARVNESAIRVIGNMPPPHSSSLAHSLFPSPLFSLSLSLLPPLSSPLLSNSSIQPTRSKTLSLSREYCSSFQVRVPTNLCSRLFGGSHST